MALPLEKEYTIQDIYDLPEGERAELIDGKLYMMAPSSTNHQRIVADMLFQIKSFIESNAGECEVFPAPFAVFLNETDTTYVEPDLCVICDERKITKKGCMGAPDWIMEIVSPASKRMDYYVKLFKYRSAGVKEYWIVDEEKKEVTVYDFANDNMEQYAMSEEIAVNLYEGKLNIHF